jgi:hypothetical protein
MARMTLLELVKDIMYELDPDKPIYTIYQTVDSEKIANLIVTTYYSIIDGKDWPNLYTMFQLTETSASTPCHMTIPTGVMDVQYVKYNTRQSTDTKDKYVEIKFMEPENFMSMLDARDSSATEVTQITSTIYYNFYNDRPPTYYTSLNETTAIFDAFDSDVETYLKTIKTQCYGKVYPTVTIDDDTYLDLPPDAFSYLLNSSKAIAYNRILKFSDVHAEQEVVTQRRRMSQEAWKIRNGYTYSNYGRQGKK